MLKKLIITGLCALSAAAVITGCGSDAKPAASSAQSAPAEKKKNYGWCNSRPAR